MSAEVVSSGPSNISAEPSLTINDDPAEEEWSWRRPLASEFGPLTRHTSLFRPALILPPDPLFSSLRSVWNYLEFMLY
jgi:hypothetical protein